MLSKVNYITAIKVSLIVGTTLNLINNNDIFLNGNWTGKKILQVGLTYLIPLLVSLYSSWKGNKEF